MKKPLKSAKIVSILPQNHENIGAVNGMALIGSIMTPF
jgi:hypothetical protein